jgi:hypothetical protein
MRSLIIRRNTDDTILAKLVQSGFWAAGKKYPSAMPMTIAMTMTHVGEIFFFFGASAVAAVMVSGLRAKGK